MPPTTLLGVDCATLPTKTGLARAVLEDGRWALRDARIGTRSDPPAAVLAAWLAEDPGAVLALDAPLGWPADLGDALAGHRAGDAIDAPSERLFARATDHAVHARHGKMPLEVGAGWIARTARATLGLLDEVRRATGQPLPLAWSPSGLRAAAAIEVYPAATLIAHGHALAGYKVPGSPARTAVVRGWPDAVVVPPSLDLVALSADVFDAIVCVLAGADFLAGAARGPDDPELARGEGWIWVRG
jgi:predicted RNase H-like nuclease